MARRKKRKGAARDGEEERSVPRPAPEKLSRPFAEALRGVTPAPKRAGTAPARPSGPRPEPPRPAAPEAAPLEPRPVAPLERYDYADRAAFQQAFAGVRPLEDARKRRDPAARVERPAPRRSSLLDEREEEARRRLDRLVAGDVRFEVVRDEDGSVRGQRAGAHPSHLRALAGAVAPQGSLDLHGFRGSEAEREVARFVRAHQLRGDRVLLIVHGKGRHSAGEIGVLVDHVLRALTEGGAAPYVMAFRSAPERLGALGALVVRLRDG